MSINFRVSDKVRRFSFTADCKNLDGVLSKVNTVMAASSANTRFYFIVAFDGKLGVIAYNQDSFCLVTVQNATTEGDGIFGIAADVLQGIIKNRAAMDFKFEGGDLSFKLSKGKYSGKIVSLPVSDENRMHINSMLSQEENGNDSSITPEALATLREGMSVTALKDVFTKAMVVSHITFRSGSVVVSSFTKHHFAQYTNENGGMKRDMRVALPINHFAVIDKMIEVQSEKSIKFSLRPDSIRVRGPSFLLSLPATQTDDSNFTLVDSFLAQKKSAPCSVGIDKDKLDTLVNNLYTLRAVNSAFLLSITADGAKITFKTSVGSASDVLKVKTFDKFKPAKASIDPLLLADLLRLVKQKQAKAVTMRLRPDSVLTLEAKTEAGGKLVLASSLTDD